MVFLSKLNIIKKKSINIIELKLKIFWKICLKICLKKVILYVSLILFKIDFVNISNIILQEFDIELLLKIMLGSTLGYMFYRQWGIKNLTKDREKKADALNNLNNEPNEIKHKKWGEWDWLELKELELKTLDKHIKQRVHETADYAGYSLVLSIFLITIKIFKKIKSGSGSDID